jgi:hypothetical protein
MGTGRQSKFITAAALATMLVATTAQPARAGCSVDDLITALGNVFKGTYSYLQDSECAGHLSDPAFWVVAGAVSVTAMHSPGAVSSACDEVKNWKSSLAGGAKDAQDTKNKASDWLQKLGVSASDLGAAGKSINDILDAAGGVAGVMSFFTCACNMAQMGGLGQAAQVTNDCIVGALCALDEFVFGNSCDNTQKPIELRDCTDRATPIYTNGDFQCDANGFCVSGNIISSGDYSGMACFCPKPMEMKFTQSIWCGDGDGTFDCYRCYCPEGTKRAGDTEVLRRICLCDDGKLVGADGKCPSPSACGCSCPSTQVTLKVTERPNGQCDCTCGCKPGEELVDGKCVPACSDPTKVLLANGTCCDRKQVATCGTCCGPGLTPNAASGSCEFQLVATPPQIPPSQPPPSRRRR